MDSENNSIMSTTPKKKMKQLARALLKFLRIPTVATAGVYPEKQSPPTKSDEAPEKDSDNRGRRVKKQAFIAKLFATISTIKAAYAELQFSQSPYDPDGIQSSDEIIVSEMKKLSQFKLCYLKKKKKKKNTDNPNQTSETETSLLLSDLQEHRSLVRMYEITSKKLDYQLKIKQSEILFLREKLAEATRENMLLEKSLLLPLSISDTQTSHFVAFYQQTIKSIRRFVRVLISSMDSANWDFVAAAESIHPGFCFHQHHHHHQILAIESVVCRVMFECFNFPCFDSRRKGKQKQKQKQTPQPHNYLFNKFTELNSRSLSSLSDYISRKPRSRFALFCRFKYSQLVHPKMEASLFGEVSDSVFYSEFLEMAKQVWLLHCLGWSFEPEVSIFQVSRGSCFSEVYMESLGGEEEEEEGCLVRDMRVGFTVVPGFRVGKTIVQCQVCLC